MLLEITEIRSCWETLVVPGLQAIKRQCDAEWRLEDVYAKCLRNEWTLFTAPDINGFLILSQYQDEYSTAKRLVVECAYYSGAVNPFVTYEPFLFELAASIGAACVEFRSPRLGFGHKGWQIADVIYRKEVSHGQE